MKDISKVFESGRIETTEWFLMDEFSLDHRMYSKHNKQTKINKK